MAVANHFGSHRNRKHFQRVIIVISNRNPFAYSQADTPRPSHQEQLGYAAGFI